MTATDKLSSRNQPAAEPAVVVDLGHGRWMINRGTHQGHEALFFEPAPAPGPTMTPAPAFASPDMVQSGTVCIRFDALEAMTFLLWWLARVQDPLRTPADPADFAGAKWIRAFPAEHEDRRDASAMSRALAKHDALPDEHRPTDSEPLRNCLPGIWPTVGDLRALLSGGAPPVDPEGARKALLAMEITGGKLVMSIGVEALAMAIEGGPMFEEGTVVTDHDVFAAEVLTHLQDEDEVGTNLIHRAFDSAFEAVAEDGGEGVTFPEEMF